MKTQHKNLYGLVLTGGKSSRMKSDKAALEFHGKKQSVYGYELLMPFCEKVFLSNRQEQEMMEGQKGLPQIHDQGPFLNIGPLGGILSAMKQYPDVSWLVLACDLPFVNSETIQYLISHRDPKKAATAFISTQDGLPEPLCAIYEAQSSKALLKHFENGKTCPRKYLLNSRVEHLKQPDTIALTNINTPQEYNQALDTFKNRKISGHG